jgi:hypothetical protein
MRHIVWTAGAAVLLAGCGGDHGSNLFLDRYETDKAYHQALIKTEKIQLFKEGESVLFLTATYMRKEKYTHTPEPFIVGVYETLPELSAESVVHTLRLEGHPPEQVVPLKKDDPRLKNISFQAPWRHFFMVTFPYVPQERLTLRLAIPSLGSGVMYFAKRAKYTFTKKAF